MRLILAIRVFFVVLFRAQTAERIRKLLETSVPGEAEPPKPLPQPRRPEPPKKPTRSDAVTLLATLQREARFIDLAEESLDEYTDEQVGAAARDVLRDCRKVLDRVFELKPVVSQDEGAETEIPSGYDAGRFRFTGNVVGEPPFRGRLVHHGWEAAKCELPAWSGSEQATRVIAPAEIEL